MVAKTSMPEPKVAMGKYIYAIIPWPGEPREFASPSIRYNGQPQGVVHTVQFEDLAAVVSDHPRMKFQEFERTRANMMTHTRVLEEVMEEFTILPVRFGTVGPSGEAIQEQVLERRRHEFLSLIAEMEGRVELCLKVIWPEQVIFPEIVKESSPAMRRLRARIKGRSAAATHFERIRLGEMIELAMDKKRAEDAERILAGLRPLADAHKLNRLLLDRMVINAAFLVSQDRQAEFDEAVRQVRTELKDRMLFKYLGPVPPYNFVLIIIYWDKEEAESSGDGGLVSAVTGRRIHV